MRNDSSRVEGHAEAEGRPGYMGNAQPSEYQASPAVTSSNSPANVPSEGRGEWMPFDLDAALGGAGMITRDGTPAKDFRRIEGKAPFPKYPYEATVNDTVYSYTGKGKFFDPYEEALDLFMLPTEGSGA